MVRQETRSRAPGDHSSAVAPHSSLISSPDCSQVLVTAHSSSHVALGDAGPTWGSQLLGAAWRDEMRCIDCSKRWARVISSP